MCTDYRRRRTHIAIMYAPWSDSRAFQRAPIIIIVSRIDSETLLAEKKQREICDFDLSQKLLNLSSVEHFVRITIFLISCLFAERHLPINSNRLDSKWKGQYAITE